MRHAFRAASAAIFVLAPGQLLAVSLEAAAVDTENSTAAPAEEEAAPEDIVVTGARTKLPITA